jgi:hypothetical protein
MPSVNHLSKATKRMDLPEGIRPSGGGEPVARNEQRSSNAGRSYRLEQNHDFNDYQFEGSSPRTSRMASRSKSRASGTYASRDDAQEKIDGETYGL